MTTRADTGAGKGRMLPLDGIRALAVLAVLGFHGQALAAGYLGVDVFLVLSGFLITGLLLAEKERTGRIWLGGFLLRRAFRLLPALYVYLAVGLALVAVTKPRDEVVKYLANLAATVGAVENWLHLGWRDSVGLWSGHLWSLSVEQEFYLVWPLILLGLVALRRRVPLEASIMAAVVLVVLWRVVVVAWTGLGMRAYLGTDTRADALLLGALVSVLYRKGALARLPGAAWAALSWAAWLALAGFAVLGPGLAAKPTPLTWGGQTVVASMAALVVAAAVAAPERGPARWLSSGPAVWLGGVSYAFYLWHYPIVVLLDPALTPVIGRAPMILVAAVLTAVVAEASRRFVEVPAARYRAPALAALRRRRGGVASSAETGSVTPDP